MPKTMRYQAKATKVWLEMNLMKLFTAHIAATKEAMKPTANTGRSSTRSSAQFLYRS